MTSSALDRSRKALICCRRSAIRCSVAVRAPPAAKLPPVAGAGPTVLVGSLMPVGLECHPGDGAARVGRTPKLAPTPTPAIRRRRVRPAHPRAGDPLDLPQARRVIAEGLHAASHNTEMPDFKIGVIQV